MKLATRYFTLFAAACLALAAAGCTGSNLLSTGNSQLAFEFEVVGLDNTVLEFDCVNISLSVMKVRPLDGICAAPASNVGDPCLGTADCVGGPCEGGSANSVIPNDINVVTGNGPNFGNLLGVACELPDLPKFCGVSGAPCSSDDDCDLTNPFNTCNDSLNDFEAEAFANPVPFTTTEGLYQISSMPIGVKMFQSSPPESAVCLGSVDVAAVLGDDLRFLVSSGSSKTVRFRIDVAVMEQWALETCGPSVSNLIPDVIQCLNCDGAP